MKTVYLTGGTGFLGSHFIRNYLSTRAYDVQCFVRGGGDGACTQRVKQTVLAVNASYPGKTALNLDGVTAIRSDITLPRLGLSEGWLETARRRPAGSTFFHFASSLNFEEKNKDAIYDHNINGLKHAVDVASALRCGAFFYISTAYTVGVHEGHVAERLHRPAAFNNYYEETKCAAEHLITEQCGAKGLRLVIVRPSVVIGPSKSCKTGGSKTGLYGLIREMHRLKPHLKRVHVPVTAYGNPDAGVNLIPVDYVCHDIYRLFDDPGVRSGLHHATADNNVNIAALVELIKRHLGLPNVVVERPERFDSERAPAIERLLARTTAFYDSITRATKHFEKRAGAKWILGMDEVERYVIEAVRVFDPVEIQGPDREEIAVTGDRVGLSVYAAGNLAAEPGAFINAAGDPV
jgi:nucleoside-diphosphate-sugar epimerase